MSLKIGTSGFSFPDWRGTVYPESLKREDALRYYADDLGMDCVEINSTYYTLVSQRSFEGMERKTPAGFEFTVKAYRGTTHDPFDPRLGNRADLKKAEEVTRKFAFSVEPLARAGKLGAVLLQFPPFFHARQRHKDYILMCREWLGKGAPIAVEFRNRAWAEEEHFRWLESYGLASCTVDEPPLPRLMPFVNRVTADTAYFRMHGRNRQWFNVPADLRYDYRYSEEELKSFVPEIRKAREQAKKIYVFFNNCHKGSALANARELKHLLGVAAAPVHSRAGLLPL